MVPCQANGGSTGQKVDVEQLACSGTLNSWVLCVAFVAQQHQREEEVKPPETTNDPPRVAITAQQHQRREGGAPATPDMDDHRNHSGSMAGHRGLLAVGKADNSMELLSLEAAPHEPGGSGPPRYVLVRLAVVESTSRLLLYSMSIRVSPALVDEAASSRVSEDGAGALEIWVASGEGCGSDQMFPRKTGL